MKCKHEIDIGSETHNGCDNHVKLVLKTGVVEKSFCQNKCPYRVDVSEGLGDTAAKVLSSVGITKKRVSAVIGKDCGCTGRQDALNNIVRYETPKIQPICLDNATRHLLYRIYPMTHNDSWKWNLDQLAKRWSVFNGKTILAIGYDSKTAMPSEVLSYCEQIGIQFDQVIRKRNIPELREVVTWFPLLESLNPESAQPDEIVFAAHSKGVRHDTGSEHIRWWAELMYQLCLDDIETVQRHLMGRIFAGAFRRFNQFDFPGNHIWHYSGTFYWFRLHDVGKRSWRHVDQFFAGTESWPGAVAERHEGSCLFADNCGDLYDRGYWEREILPAWKARMVNANRA